MKDSCPDFDVWRRYQHDEVDPSETESLEAHLNTCEACQQCFDELVRTQRSQPLPRATVPMPPLEGYTFERWLAAGATGDVYLARHVGLNRLVAIKCVPARGGSADVWEARAAATARHPSVIEVLDVGVCEGTAYLVMEYLEHGSLANLVAGGNPLEPKLAARLVASAADAAGHFHTLGLVHRDLKPQNLLLAGNAPSWKVKVIDFGLARAIGTPSVGQSLALGTPEYMAPEQAKERSEKIGPPADVYALGAVLYHLLTGRPPFRGVNPFDTLLQLTSREAVPLRQVVPRVHRDLETIVMTCLEKEPRKRYEDACALANDLERFLDKRPITARPIGPLGRTWRWCRRSPQTAALLFGSIAVILGALALVSSFYVSARASQRNTEELLRESAQNLELLARLVQDPLDVNSNRRRQEIQLALDAAKSLLQRRPDLTELRQSVAEIMMQLADFDNRHQATPRAVALMHEAIALVEPQLERNPTDRGSRERLARLVDILAECQSRTGMVEESVATSRRACAVIEPLLGSAHVADDDRLTLSVYRLRLARRLQQAGAADEAQQIEAATRPFVLRLLDQRPNDVRVLDVLAEYVEISKDVPIRWVFNQARERLNYRPGETRFLHWSALGLLAKAHRASSKSERLAYFRRIEEFVEPHRDRILYQAFIDPDDFQTLNDSAFVFFYLGLAYESSDRFGEAEETYRQSLRIAEHGLLDHSSTAAPDSFYPQLLIHIAVMRLSRDASIAVATSEMKDRFHRLGLRSKRPEVWRPRYIRALADTAMMARTRGLRKQADELIEQAIRELDGLEGVTVDQAEKNLAATELWIQVGKQHWNDPDHARANEAFSKATATALATGDTKLYDDRLRRQARFFNDIGEFAEAYRLQELRTTLSLNDPNRRQVLQTAFHGLAQDIHERGVPRRNELQELECACRRRESELAEGTPPR